MAQTAVAYPTTLSDVEIMLTDAAKAKLAELMAEADPELMAVRIFVTGGGCGGMQYGLTFAEGATGYDSVIEGEGFRVVVDPVALNYMQGCQIDYAANGLNESFVFNNVFQAVGGSGACGGCGGGGF